MQESLVSELLECFHPRMSTNPQTWVTSVQFRERDRAKSTKYNHKDALRKYTAFCRVPKQQRGLGLGANYSPQTVSVWCITRDEMNDERLAEYFTYYFNVYAQSDVDAVNSTMRKLHGWASYCCKTLGDVCNRVRV